MGLQQFFQHFFPIRSLDDLREEAFALMYCVKGMSYDSIENMLSSDREWYIRRLYKQLQHEDEQMKKATKRK